MNRSLKLAAVAATAALALTACADLNDDDRCKSKTTVLIFNTATGHYHYGSPTGKPVPAYKVPQSARKVPGYKPVGPAKPPVVKAPAAKPGTGSKPGYKAPAPRTGGRR